MSLAFKNIFHGYGGLEVLKDVSFKTEPGRITVLLGPSGCGKSTLLKLAAGFEKPVMGSVCFNESPVTGPGVERGMMFQTPVLFDWLTVAGNVAFGLRQAGVRGKEQQDRVNRFMALTGLADFKDYYPGALSGGMQQRAALARLLVMEPQCLLMDEPFSGLDAQLRPKMQELVLSVWRDLRPTVLFVTHDVEEALVLGHRILVFSKRPGHIVKDIERALEKKDPLDQLADPGFGKEKKNLLEILRDL